MNRSSEFCSKSKNDIVFDLSYRTIIYLQEGNDKRPQREVCGLVKFRVKLFNGECRVLSKTTERKLGDVLSEPHDLFHLLG